MTERIVDDLEQIEVEHKHRERAAMAAQPRQRLLHFLQQHRAIGQAGQAVMAGHECDLRFRLLLRGDVLMNGDPSAAGHRPVIDGKDAPVAHGIFGVVRLIAAYFRQNAFDV